MQSIPSLLLFNIYAIAYAVNTLGGHEDKASSTEHEQGTVKHAGVSTRDENQKHVSTIGLNAG
ncbi:MAG TPA: hypothetical protein VIE17_03220 [Methylophilaceae bacterium]|jgi:hypothetical protein